MTEETVFDNDLVGSLDPVEVLYEFDGFQVFTSLTPDRTSLLVYTYNENGDLLAVSTSQEMLDDLRLGRISLFDALHRPWVWLVDCDRKTVRRCSWGLIPSKHLPRPGVTLSGIHSRDPHDITTAEDSADPRESKEIKMIQDEFEASESVPALSRIQSLWMRIKNSLFLK